MVVIVAKVICAWHTLYFGEEKILNENIETATGKDSHGICVACKRMVDKELEEMKAASVVSKQSNGAFAKTHKG
jgi:hypothetical protein